MGIRRSPSCRVKVDVESILYARARAYFPALCVQPLKKGRGRDTEGPSITRWTRNARGGERLFRKERTVPAERGAVRVSRQSAGEYRSGRTYQ